MLKGTQYPACITVQYGYKPATNTTRFTVAPQVTDVVTPDKHLKNYKKKQTNSHYAKSYLIAFLLGFPLVFCTIFLALLFIPKGLPHYVTLILYFLLFSPLFIVFGYVLYRALVPVTKGMPFKRVRQWILLYPLVVGLGLFWALLSLVFEIIAPSLLREYRETTFPILIIAAITLILSMTQLRHPVARFLNKLFGTEPIKESNGTE